MLELRGLTRRYGDETVLDGVSFEVPAGGTLVLFGPSGAGKTVLLRAVAGVVEPDAGSVHVDGRDLHGIEPEARGIGMAFQNFALFPHLTAFENIAAPLHARGDARERRRERVDEVARLLKIEHVLEQRPAALSNGQKQRTSLARALVAEPRLLLLDDPLRNVDAKLRFEMRLELPRLLGELGTTVVYVTQDYREAMALGDRIAVLVDGRLVQIGTPAEIYDTPATRQIATLFGDPAINLLDVVPERDAGGVFVTLSGRRLALDPGLARAVGHPCTLGLRPEEIGFAADDDESAIPVHVEAETPLNEKVVDLVTTARGREILVSRPAHEPGPDGERARLSVPPGRALLFEREDGEGGGAGDRADPRANDGEGVSAARSGVGERGARPASGASSGDGSAGARGGLRVDGDESASDGGRRGATPSGGGTDTFPGARIAPREAAS